MRSLVGKVLPTYAGEVMIALPTAGTLVDLL
jgi:hypothetical protein